MKRKIAIAALYIRVSTDAQEELSPDAQIRLLLDYAHAHEMVTSPELIFRDDGISGRKANKRPAFQKMIATAKQSDHPIDVILVWKFSRFARNQEESIVYKSMLKKQCDVEVISITEPIIEGPFGSLIERIIEWMDEYYSVNLSQEVKRGMTEKAMRGGYQTAPCLGYESTEALKPYTVKESEADVVKDIFQRYVSGQDPTAIARYLNERGYRAKRGAMFDKRSIDRIILNRFYIGKVVWNGIERDGSHELFIDQDLWNQAQAVYSGRYRKIKRRSVSTCKHWLSGLLKCSICEATLCYSGKAEYKYFTCWRYAKGFHRENNSITVDAAERGVMEFLSNIVSGKDYEFTIIPKEKPVQDENAAIRKELERLFVREQRIKNAYELGVDSIEEYSQNKKRIQEERLRLQSMIREPEPVDMEEAKSKLSDKIKNVYEMLSDENVDNEVKGQLIRSIVSEIIWDKKEGKMEIHLFY